MRSGGPSGRASIRAADDVLEADLQSDEIVACFEEALGERQPEMGMDAAAGREANAESAEAAPRLEAAAKHNRTSFPGYPCHMSPFSGHAILCKQGRQGRGALPRTYVSVVTVSSVLFHTAPFDLAVHESIILKRWRTL